MGHRDFFHNVSEEEGRLASGAGTILRAARNETGERSGVSPPVLRSCTGKLTHAAHQISHFRAVAHSSSIA